MIVAKLNGKIVQIVKYKDTVGFSDEKGWFCVCTDFDVCVRRQQFVKWVPASTVFDWVADFAFFGE